MKKYFVSFVFLVLFAGYAALQYLNSNTTAAYTANNPVSSQPIADSNTSSPQSAPPPDSTPTQTQTTDTTPAPTPTTQPTPAQTPTPAPQPQGEYVDGTYTGPLANAYYGDVQVQATISGGKLVNVQFLQYPNSHGTSVFINQQAMPILTQEAIQAQNANVNGVSGATFTSQAFVQSLSSALAQAKA